MTGKKHDFLREVVGEEKHDPEHVAELGQSHDTLGPLLPVIDTPYGYASGNQRLEAGWKGENEIKVLGEDKVPDRLTALKILTASNIQKEKAPEWWTRVIQKGAELYVTDRKVPKHEVAAAMKKDFGVASWRIDAYLGMEYKQEKWVEAGKKGGRPSKEEEVPSVDSEALERKPHLPEVAAGDLVTTAADGGGRHFGHEDWHGGDIPPPPTGVLTANFFTINIAGHEDEYKSWERIVSTIGAGTNTDTFYLILGIVLENEPLFKHWMDEKDKEIEAAEKAAAKPAKKAH